jgi:hypothetical protein
MIPIPSLRDVRLSTDQNVLFEHLSWVIEEYLDFTVPENCSVFYSGNNKVHAENFANSTGKFIVQHTPGGKYLDKLDLFNQNITYARAPLKWHKAVEIWDMASAQFAKQAKGKIFTFIQSIPPIHDGQLRTWYRIELPILLYQNNVSGINFLNNDGGLNAVYSKLPEIEYLFEELEV